jgi:hypothetical protein
MCLGETVASVAVPPQAGKKSASIHRFRPSSGFSRATLDGRVQNTDTVFEASSCCRGRSRAGVPRTRSHSRSRPCRLRPPARRGLQPIHIRERKSPLRMWEMEDRAARVARRISLSRPSLLDERRHRRCLAAEGASFFFSYVYIKHSVFPVPGSASTTADVNVKTTSPLAPDCGQKCRWLDNVAFER